MELGRLRKLQELHQEISKKGAWYQTNDPVDEGKKAEYSMLRDMIIAEFVEETIASYERIENSCIGQTIGQNVRFYTLIVGLANKFGWLIQYNS